MIKSEIRKKIIRIRKFNNQKNLAINFYSILNILKKKKITGKMIGGYYPYNYEIDVLEILEFFERKKYKISLPKIGTRNQMDFFEWSVNDPLSINKYGIPEPVSKKVIYPNILLIPLVAFDKNRNRLGYGGGYYDRYLAKFKKNKIIKIGIANTFQKMQKIPISKYDIRLDHIVTEKKIY